MADPAPVERATAGARDRFGRIDVLINNVFDLSGGRATYRVSRMAQRLRIDVGCAILAARVGGSAGRRVGGSAGRRVALRAGGGGVAAR